MRGGYVSLQSLRAIAALAVVLFHFGGATGFESKVWDTQVLDLAHPLGLLGVDLFFVISGFIMVVTTAALRPGTRSAGRFLVRRASRIYPPYVLVTAAVLVVHLARPGLVNSSEEGAPDIVASFLLLPQDGTPLLLVGWTLVHEMLFYVVFAVGLLLPRHGLVALLSSWGLVTVVLAAVVPADANPWLQLGANLLNLEFLMGATVGRLMLTKPLFDPRAVLVAGATLLAGTSWLAVTQGALPGDPLWVLGCGGSLAVLLYGVVASEARHGWTPLRRLSRVGDSSYSLYLTHVLTLGVLAVAFRHLPLHGPAGHAAGLVLALGACLGGGWLYYWAVELPGLAVSRRWLAPRSRRSTGGSHPMENVHAAAAVAPTTVPVVPGQWSPSEAAAARQPL